MTSLFGKCGQVSKAVQLDITPLSHDRDPRLATLRMTTKASRKVPAGVGRPACSSEKQSRIYGLASIARRCREVLSDAICLKGGSFSQTRLSRLFGRASG